MSIGRRILLWLAQFSTALAIFAQPAHADSYSVIVRASCMPSISFFTLETYVVDVSSSDALEADKSILTSEKLERSPYNCELINGVSLAIKGICRASPDHGCAPGFGAHDERLALFVNGEFVPFQDASLGPDDERNWLSIGDRPGLKQSIEISGLRGNGQDPPALFVLHCEIEQTHQRDVAASLSLDLNPLREDYPVFYPSGPPGAPWLTLNTRCRGFKKVVSAR